MLSVIILTKNEELMIRDCVLSVKKIADEIIVVDGGSTDKTVEIAEKLGAKVFKNKFEDFSKQRECGLTKAKGEWLFYLDADERLSKELQEELMSKLKNNSLSCSGYKIYRKNIYFGKYEWPAIESLERLFKRDRLKGWYGKVHESPIVDGAIGTLDNNLIHYTHRNLTLMLEKTLVWSKIEAKIRFDSGHPKMTWWRFPRVMVTAFFNSYIKEGGWKIGVPGLVESMYQGFSMFITYVQLWELQNEDRKV